MNTFYVQAIFTASIGGILYGYDMGVISGALPLLSEYFQLTPSQEEWIVSLLYFGGGVGAASGGFICDKFGRKTAILVTDVIFGIGAAVLYSAMTVESIFIGRFVVGWAVAVSGIADVAYLHEISSVWEEEVLEDERPRGDDLEDNEAATASNSDSDERSNKSAGGRGSVISVNEACISLGFLLAFGVAFILGDAAQNASGGNVDGEAIEAWRMMFAFGGVLAAFQFVGMLFMPESPVFLHGKGRIQDAADARNKIRGTTTTSSNLRESRNSIRHRRISRSSSMENVSQNTQNELGINRSQNDGIEMNASTSSTNLPQTPTLSNSSSSLSEEAEEEQFHTPRANINFSERLVYMWIKVRSMPSRLKVQYQQLVQEILLPYKRQCAIAFFLAASQQFCGHPSVLSFSAEIFAELSQSSHDVQTANEENDISSNNGGMTPMELTVGIGILKFLTTCIVILLVEKGGRIAWLLSGMSCILLSLTFLCIAFIGHGVEEIGQSSDNMQQETSSSFKNGLGIVGIYGVAVGYAASYGPLTWLITSELFPASIRGRALGFATIVTYMAAGLVSRTFLSLQNAIGLTSCFALYWTATLVSIMLVWLGVPDTGGDRTPEQIAAELNDLWIWGARRHRSRCPRRMTRSGERTYGSSTSLRSLGNYGSWRETSNHDAGISHDPSLDQGDVTTTSSAKASSRVAHSGLTPRRLASNRTKEII